MIDLKELSNDDLVLRMEKLVRTERKITHLVLLHIAEIESRKIYAEMGYDGMYSYLTRGLGYSEGSAYRRLQSARLLKKVPSISEKIEDGSINLTQLTQVQKCIKENTKSGKSVSVEKAIDVLQKLENKNSFETQKTLALEMNLPVQSHEKIKPQSDDSIRLEVTLTEEQFRELEKAKNLLSHICPDGSWAEVISTLAKKFNQQKLKGRANNLKEKSKKVDEQTNSTQIVIAARDVVANSNSCGTVPVRRKYISIYTKRFLLNKADHCCEYRNPDTGKRCSSKYLLEVDHVHPVALGGTNEINNLRVLCRTHNALAAQKVGLTSRQTRAEIEGK
ncbi:HNH endonuclease [Bdellovibrio bacteriovorus]|uniref:HNH endonuclease n=1 Tax=Bdellovibrio TaxID=958 RepID=UPI0035A95C6B